MLTRVCTESYSLSPMQFGMLYHHIAAPSSGVAVEQIVIDLREELDLTAYREAWDRVASRHPAFRTAFRWEDIPDAVQEVHPEVRVPFEILDQRHLTEERQTAEFESFLRSDRARGFDVTVTPLLRVAVFLMGPAHTKVTWTFHHIILDGRSFAPVLRELFAVYDALRRGHEPELPPTRPFREYIDWLARRDDRSDEAFWRKRLHGFQAPTPLPTGSIPPKAAGRGEQEARLDRDATRALRAAAEVHGLSLNTFLQGAWAILLQRYTGEHDVVFGATRACRSSTFPGAEDVVGIFINTLPVRQRVPSDAPLLGWLQELRAQERTVRDYEHSPLVRVQGWSEVPGGTPLFESIIVFDHEILSTSLRKLGGEWERRDFQLIEQTSYPLTLYGYAEPELYLKLAYDRSRIADEQVERLLGSLMALLEAFPSSLEAPLGDLPVLCASDRHRLEVEWNATERSVGRECIHTQIERQAVRTPHALALSCAGQSLTYQDLDQRANRLAHVLRRLGVGPDVRVGIFLERSLDLIVGVLATHKAGGAYVPLDPTYPHDRLAWMLEDARVSVLLTHSHLGEQLSAPDAHVLYLDRTDLSHEPTSAPETDVRPEHLAYVIYTSGSTGRPKGVMVEHRNVVNFFAGMDERLGPVEGGVWLAVTSLSFDISVLELLWTLARGCRVVVYTAEDRKVGGEARVRAVAADRRPLQFSLFYFSSDESEHARDKYRLLLEGARFADQHGFAAVWTPERHFHAFGGLYPNPAVTGAAVAAITRNVQIRAGSVVLPLHHPARVAEEWAVVDNLSGGRVGISFASGWQPNDFVLRPENYADAKQVMLREIETVRRFWRGDAVSLMGPLGKEVEVRTLPRPIQSELPFWITTAGNPESFRLAGAAGANLLTHLLGQSIEEVGEKIAMYRQAWREAGHAGEGVVSLMLHTFVGDDDAEVKEVVREPLREYLRSSISLIKQYAWSFPAFKKRTDGGAAGLDFDQLSAEEMDALLEYSFERYYETSGLFGSVERCSQMVEKVRGIGVDDIACLVDFGIPSDQVLSHLSGLAVVRRRSEESVVHSEGSIPSLICEQGVTHLQCTPSLISLLLQDEQAHAAWAQLRNLLLGGEALPSTLVKQIHDSGFRGELHNMYGPTETTIWSSTHPVSVEDHPVPLGRPIANTQFYIVDEQLQPVPVGVPGELLIGGAGVVRGYLNRPELTTERFVPDPFRAHGRLYRTGDLVRHRSDGTLEFLGRLDHQVKIRGYRIELGEIESVLAEDTAVHEAVVVAREDVPGDKRLVGYVVAKPGAELDVETLRASLQDRLPDFMVPSHVLVLPEMPRTPNLKIDRKALPSPRLIAEAVATASEPSSRKRSQSELERQIADVWKEVLQVTVVNVEDNFFDLGGHSLLAVQVHARLKALIQRPLAITDLFRLPTVQALARHLAAEPNEDSPAAIPSQAGQSRAELRRQISQRRQQVISEVR